MRNQCLVVSLDHDAAGDGAGKTYMFSRLDSCRICEMRKQKHAESDTPHFALPEAETVRKTICTCNSRREEMNN